MARLSVHAVSSISAWKSSWADALGGDFEGRTVSLPAGCLFPQLELTFLSSPPHGRLLSSLYPLCS